LIDSKQNLCEYLIGFGNLSHLKHDISAMPDYFSADLDKSRQKRDKNFLFGDAG
jgi:hypothetical protein